MVEQLKEEQAFGSHEPHGSQLKLCDKSKTIAMSVTDAGPSSLSPETAACHMDGEIPFVIQLDTINIARPAHGQNQVVKNVAPPIFDEKLTSRPRDAKKRKQFTVDNFDSEHTRLSFDQHYSKGVQDVLFIAKQESISDTRPDHLKIVNKSESSNVDPPELELERMYDELSQKIINELLVNVQLSAKGEIQITNNRCTVRRVTSMIETFVTHNRVRLVLGGKDEATVTPSDGGNTRNSRLIQLEAKRNKMIKMLSFNSQDCYMRVIPVDIVRRLKEAGRCIADKVKPDIKGELRCTRTRTDSEAAHRLLQEIANLPQPRDFSRVTALLQDIIGHAFCKQFHQEKPRAGLERLHRHFFQTADEEQKLEREAELVQLEQWLSRIIEPLVTRGRVHRHEVMPDGSSDNSSDHTNGISAGEPTKTVKLTSSVPALLVFRAGVPSVNPAAYEVALFRHGGGVTCRQFKPYTKWNKAQKDLSPELLVETIAKSKLTTGDIVRKGKIYVFWHRGNFGWVKIGHTEQKKKKDRIDQWEAQCGFDASEHDFGREDDDLISHPYRVEKLIHAEMKKERREFIECQGCGRSHDEWFQIDVNDALAIVKKWTDWMQESNPYDENGKFKTEVKVTLPPMMGREKAKVILKPARGGRAPSRFARQPLRRSLRNATQEASKQSKQI